MSVFDIIALTPSNIVGYEVSPHTTCAARLQAAVVAATVVGAAVVGAAVVGAAVVGAAVVGAAVVGAAVVGAAVVVQVVPDVHTPLQQLRPVAHKPF